MDEEQKVWVPHIEDGFELGRILDLGAETITVETFKSGKPVTAPYDRVFFAEEDETKEVEDNCSLMYLNEATLLHNLKLRYKKDAIYTYVANILIAVNPYKDMPVLYSSDTINRYRGKSLGVLPPHVFAIADKTFRDMVASKQSQSVIVSGESGAGKTETTKYILRYLTESHGQSAGIIEQRIIEANPLLEAFGNAKTVRNNNSSRFGKFVEMHFNAKPQVVGGHVSHYLLEKPRVCWQSKAERNYHIFYYLCAGAPEKTRKDLKITQPDNYQYMKHGNTQYFTNKETEKKVPQDGKSYQYQKKGSLFDIKMDDALGFSRVKEAMSKIGLTEKEQDEIFRVTAAVLHLGNIRFKTSDAIEGGCVVEDKAKESLDFTASLMGLQSSQLHEALTSRNMTSLGSSKGVIKVRLTEQQVNNARDALAKAIYSHLFDNIVYRINQCFPFESSHSYIGVLDIAGFEFFTVNSYEQFCINYCNEKLQQFFNQRVLKEEQELYAKEGLGVNEVTYVDNQDCIDLIEAKHGIMDLLDEESKVPKANPNNFTHSVHQKHKNHFRLTIPRKSKLTSHRNLRDDEGFIIRHFAGAVCYQTNEFIEKNNDALHASLEAIIQESKDAFLKGLFPERANKKVQKLIFESVGAKFKVQLGKLMDKLTSTGSSFIRCIKPNGKMVHSDFEGAQILSQLQCSGMVSVLDLMQGGFPSRTNFATLYRMYEKYLPKELSTLDPRMFCRALFHALGLNDDDYKFGLTKIFFRPGKFAEFDQLLRSDPENLKNLIKKVKRWLCCARWRKAQYGTWMAIKLKNKILYRRAALIKMQSVFRAIIVMRKHRPRIVGLKNAKKLFIEVEKMADIAKGIEDKKAKAQVSETKKQIEQFIQKIKTKIMTRKQMEDEHLKISTGLAANITNLINLKKAEEAEKERLRRIQEEMERERKRKEEEERRRKLEEEERERKRKLEEEERRKKAEMEEKRRREEEEMQRKLEEERKRLEEEKRKLEQDKKRLAEQKAKEEEEKRKERERQAQLEQERLDHEMALRLAEESQSQVVQVEEPPVAVMEVPVQASAPAKRDLAKLKYAELRDLINTSTDMEELAACKEEFHRRLKVYRQWKTKNKKAPAAKKEPGHVPESVTQSAAEYNMLAQSPRAPPPQPQPKGQRYFRVPFQAGNIGQRGYWYAHFDGPWIARQMEIHPNKQPVLLVAGKDDTNMCEMSLAETGLTRRQNAEIFEREFDEMWDSVGGKEYLLHAIRTHQARPTAATAKVSVR
ncbi:Unconventional myosin-VI [Holothuria leucospilota]|uniref:Unconventional myosin-VI n=1 Tax=Holothuria leucospilota TaxID=206669 RepID=A0A9Q1BHQ1_HOLLE|nr:Unconventional myosin-VI [Holothuria leucospilota]